MLESIRETDTAYRYGGDEFCLILPDCCIENARDISEKLIEKFTDKFPNYSLSIGLTENGPDEHLEIDALIKNADAKMYMAKKESGSQVRF